MFSLVAALPPNTDECQRRLVPAMVGETRVDSSGEIALLRNVVVGARCRGRIDENPSRHARNTVTRQNFLFLNVHRDAGSPGRLSYCPPKPEISPENTL
jgi:hypothetical protein